MDNGDTIKQLMSRTEYIDYEEELITTENFQSDQFGELKNLP